MHDVLSELLWFNRIMTKVEGESLSEGEEDDKCLSGSLWKIKIPQSECRKYKICERSGFNTKGEE